MNDKTMMRVLALSSKQAMYEVWVELGKPRTFIEWWMDETGYKFGSSHHRDMLQWIVQQQMRGEL